MRRTMRALFGLTRRAIFAVFFLGLIVLSNILLLTVDALYDAGKRGLWALGSIVADVGQPRTHSANRETVERLADRIDILEADRRRLDEDLRRTRRQIIEIGAENAKLERRAERLDADLRGTRQQMAVMEADNARLERRTQQLARERADLDATLQQSRNDFAVLRAENAGLTDESSRLRRRVAELEALDGATLDQLADINERLARRTTRMISTNLSSMGAEALPVVGAGFIVGVTFMEVRDACLTLADTRKMSDLLGGEPAVDVPACGYSPQEFREILLGGTDTETCRDLNAEMPEDLRLDCMAIPRPGEADENESKEPSDRMDIPRPGE